MTTEIGKREFLAGLGLGLTAAAQAAAQEGVTASGYKPRRLNKTIELLEDGQPIYYRGADPRLPGYEQGRALAATWADAINWEMEHGTFNLANLREFMKGLVDGGPTRSGHRGVAKQPMDGMRGSGSQILPSKIWGVTENRYVNIADPWPLNPNGELLLGAKIEDKYALENAEKTLAVPGIGFAEGGGGDMQMSLQGLAFFADQGPPKPRDGQQHFAPIVQHAQDRVLSACKANNVRFLHAATPQTIVSWLQRGAMVIEATEEVAKVGRAHTKRTMPV